jgi:hypothetical protein
MKWTHTQSGESSILQTLRTDLSSWDRLVGFTPITRLRDDPDANYRTRTKALLALHRHHHLVHIATDDKALVAYLHDQEILFHQKVDHYRSSMPLASYLLARYRNLIHVWALWVGKSSTNL